MARQGIGMITSDNARVVASYGKSETLVDVPADGVTMGEIPEAGSDLARITALGLVLAGPATSVGAIMALAWWPRIVGIVVAGGLAAAVFIGRSLVGG